MKRSLAVLLALTTLMFGANAMAAGLAKGPKPGPGGNSGFSQNHGSTVVAAGPRPGATFAWNQGRDNHGNHGNNWHGNDNNWHGNDGHGGHDWDGHGWNGHRNHSSFSFNVGWPLFWYPGSYYGYNPYYPRTTVVIERTAPVYVQQTPPPPQTASENYWYYCPDSKTFYPYVQTCPSNWLQVVPTTSP